ncbi:hypothetical protein [Trichothermofontia sp.]
MLISLFWIGLLVGTGAIYSGYYLKDCHALISFHESLEERGFWQTFSWLNSYDINVRFRPFYSLYIITLTHLIKLNWQVWHCVIGGFAIVSCILLFKALRNFGFSTLASTVFLGMTFLDVQVASWVHISVAETPAFLLMAGSIYCLSKLKETHHLRWEIAFLILAICSSLSKESFLFLLPSLIYIRAWLVNFEIRKYMTTLLVLLPFMFISFLFIRRISINHFDLKITAIQIFKSTLSIAWNGSFISLLILIILLNLFKLWNHRIFTVAWVPLILFLLIITPQIFLYARTGFTERYFLPGILGFSILFAILIDYLISYPRYVKQVAIVLIVSTLVCKFFLTLNTVETLTVGGQETDSLIHHIQSTIDEKGLDKKEINVLLITNPRVYYEVGISLRRFIKGANIYYFNVGSYPLADIQTDILINEESAAKKLPTFFSPELGFIKWNGQRDFAAIVIMPKLEPIVRDFLNSIPMSMSEAYYPYLPNDIFIWKNYKYNLFTLPRQQPFIADMNHNAYSPIIVKWKS